MGTPVQTRRAQTAQGRRGKTREILQRPTFASPSNPQLVELLRSAHGVPFFICAPRKTGRTSLALDYARRQHRLDEVLWMSVSADDFREALHSSAVFERLEHQRTGGLARFSLVVIDDLPSLEDKVASRFSDWVDHLIEEGVETLIVTTPYEDCLSDYQSDRLLIDGDRLIASQKWNDERMGETLSYFFEAPVARQSVTLAALMVLMGRGSIDDLRELGYEIPNYAHRQLRQYCPLIGIDEDSGTFDADGFPIAQLSGQLLALLNEATKVDEAPMSEKERCFERLTQLSLRLSERSRHAQGRLLLELAGGVLADDGAEADLEDDAPVAEFLPTDALEDKRESYEADEPVGIPTLTRGFRPGYAGILNDEQQEWEAVYAHLEEDHSALLDDGPPRLLVRLFGDFEIFKDGRRIDGEQLQRSKVRALMIHLALNMGRGVARDTLMERIWPDKEYLRAKDNFHATWSRLSRLLSEGLRPSPYLTNSQGICRLEATFATTDVHEFEELSRAFLFERGSVGERIETVYRLEQLYRGDILSGFHIDAYVQAAQQRYRAILVDVMLEASKLFSQEGNDTNAVWFARKAYDTDPSREDVYRVLMAMQDRAGQRTNALKTYFDCKRFLSEELGILPSQKTTALYQELILDRR
ncbi:MAG: hypothetical protein LBH56_02060 [Coriobacteriales bacterium]|jgi:DNA-binding SARP family transcriptional activator|nr:hypothetical protein [Coriobacteriales bacterium]